MDAVRGTASATKASPLKAPSPLSGHGVQHIWGVALFKRYLQWPWLTFRCLQTTGTRLTPRSVVRIPGVPTSDDREGASNEVMARRTSVSLMIMVVI